MTPSHPGDIGPDRTAQLERMLAAMRSDFDHNGDVPADASFIAQENADGTVSFIRAVLARPAVERAVTEIYEPSLPDTLHPPVKQGGGQAFDENGNLIDADHWTQQYLQESQWGGSYHVHTEDGQQFLRLIGWVGSGSIRVGFSDLTFDDTGRPVLEIVKIPPGPGFLGRCDMKYYAYEVALPAGYEGEIVIRQTIRQAQSSGEESVQTLPDVTLGIAELPHTGEVSDDIAAPVATPVSMPQTLPQTLPGVLASPADDEPVASASGRVSDGLFDDDELANADIVAAVLG